MAPPVLLDEEENVQPRLTAGCLGRAEEAGAAGRPDERRADMAV